MSDPNELSPEQEQQLQEMVAQLREADPAQIMGEALGQAFNTLAMAAQAKLGQRDARTLIDTAEWLAGAAGERVGDELAGQMRQLVVQLQQAQVQAEQQAGGTAAPEGGGAPGAAQPGAEGQSTGQAGGQQGDQRMTDRLWVPGQGGGA